MAGSKVLETSSGKTIYFDTSSWNTKFDSPGNREIFLKFVEYSSLFDPVMNEHFRRVRDKETQVHYLRKKIQNEMMSS